MKIERGIPVPSRPGRGLSAEAELMQTMKNVDSLFLKKSLATSTQMAMKYIGKGKYACRSEGQGTRVWCIK